MRTLFLWAILLVSILRASAAEDAAPRVGTTQDIIPCATAHYSFGTAVSSNGLVLFTEFNHRQIRSWHPQTRRLEVWRAKETPGMFGLATGTAGDVFVGLDLGDQGNPGKILRIAADGKEEYIVENITQLDIAGRFTGPDAWLQGHSLWHLFTSLSLGCMYLYYRSEVTLSSAHAAPEQQRPSLDHKPAPHP